jgi:8-hydroxy-5-deazaflavin:NADPH oxidoreductase
MKVGIIGTGNVGGALAGSLVKAGHAVTLASRDQDKLGAVAAATGAGAGSIAQAATADVVVLAVWYPSLVEVAREVVAANPRAILVDVTNPVAPDFSAQAHPGGPAAAEEIAAALPGTAVVKAFNTNFAQVLADPDLHGVQLDSLYATDDDAAAATVATLIASIGLRPVRAGGLVRARELEAFAWLNITLNFAGGDWRTGYAYVGAPSGALAAPVPAGAAA